MLLPAAPQALQHRAHGRPGPWHLERREKLALNASGFWSLVQLYMLAHNTPHGPYLEDLRYDQVCSVIRDFCETTDSPEDSPLFMSFMPRMVRAAEHSPGDPGAAQAMLTLFKSDCPFGAKGSKTSMNRFLSVLIRGEEECPWVPFRAFAYTLAALRLDLMTTKTVAKLALDRSEKHLEGDTTAPSRAIAR